MKLLQTVFDIEFEKTVRSWADTIESNGYSALIHVYIPYAAEFRNEDMRRIRQILKSYIPDVPVIGCSSTGVIIEGGLNDDCSIVSVMLFEDESTSVKVVPYYTRPEGEDAHSILEYALSATELKGIEVVTAAPYTGLKQAGRIIDTLPEEIEIFGGVAVGDDKHPAFVFANDCPESFDGTAIVLYCGQELHLLTNRMFGWKPIGYSLKVTKAEGPLVYEIDGKPAYDVYNHYLHIDKGDNFFYDALEFPWEVRIDEENAYLRHAKSVNPDGSILMSSIIPQGSEIHLTYGDPRRIMAHTKQTTLEIMDFAPEVINIVNCMGRKLFWSGREDVEISLLSKLMNTTGFSALGEIMRHKGTTLLNNLSIVTVAMREGPKGEVAKIEIDHFEKSANMPITARLALFINTISDELIEKNNQLNDMLYKASHDALTGLFNRGSIERSIIEYCEDGGNDWHLIMFDLDDFKKINDSSGHIEGDQILKAVSRILTEYVKEIPDAIAGRWGGEEFMIFIKGYRDDAVKEMANELRLKVKNECKPDGSITISGGVTGHKFEEDVIDTITRVDELLYQAKNSGKDRVCSDLDQ